MTRARDLSRLANTNAITVDSNNNIGIGSLTPDAKLDVVGVVSATSFYGDLTSGAVAATTGNIVTGVVTTLSGTNLNYSGIGTIGSLKISSGIVTATSGVVTYYGDGSNLTGVAAAGAGGANDITSSLFF